MSSYRTHVGRELEMMLSGLKPLAMFYEDADAAADERIIPEKRFSSYVEKGEFAKGELILEYAVDPRTNRPVKVRYVFYALVSEQWRIEAMRLAIKVMSKMGRADEGLDRIMGSLLGHSAEEIDEFIGKHKRQYGLFALEHYNSSEDTRGPGDDDKRPIGA